MLLAKYSSDLETDFLTMFNSIERSQFIKKKNSIPKNIEEVKNEESLTNDPFQCELCQFNRSCEANFNSNSSVNYSYKKSIENNDFLVYIIDLFLF